MKIRLPSDLLIILIWVVLTVIFVFTPLLEGSFIRTILGIPMVLIIPGYVLISALFPRKDDLEPVERIALSFGISIAVVPLIGLGLNYTPFGIRLIPILISLTIYTISLIIIGTYRRYSIIESERFLIQFHQIYLDIINENKPKNKIDNILTIILIISIISAIGMVIYVITVPKTGEKFTEFYILNSTTKKADNYSTNLKINIPVTYLLGVVNHEYSDINYTIKADIGKDVMSSKNLTLKNNETWEANFTILPDKKVENTKLEFLLFKDNNFTSPYRELHLWINAT